MTTDERLEAIHRRRAAITPGQWAALPDFDNPRTSYRIETDYTAGPLPILATYMIPADAEFTANAPTDIDYLLALVNRLRGGTGDGEGKPLTLADAGLDPG